MNRFLPLVGLALVACGPIAADPPKAEKPEPFLLKDDDRVVLLGNTLIEREQRCGYWEMALTTRFPDKNVQFRNLGWSGDTVWGQARAGFGTPADGFKQLKEHVAALKPTVILVGYGGNEAFDGEAGLPRFLDGLNKLLDTLAENKARIVLVSPVAQEDLGRPLPDPTDQNNKLNLYCDAMRKVAAKRGCRFVDLYDLMPDGGHHKPPVHWTDNGIHLTPYGYWRSAFVLYKGLALDPTLWGIEIDVARKKATAVGAKVDCPFDTDGDPRFKVTSETLPLLPAEKESAQTSVPETIRVLRVLGLPQGSFTLTIDGKEVVTATAKQWTDGVRIQSGPDFDQAEKLRETIVEKNRLYFHRWRPQNETYLFGFRKGEQGQNNVEIPQFDPLIAKQEEAIAKLRVPVAHTYELKAQRKEGDK